MAKHVNYGQKNGTLRDLLRTIRETAADLEIGELARDDDSGLDLKIREGNQKRLLLIGQAAANAYRELTGTGRFVSQP